ncbi:MAG: tRNA (cytidine(56)-2'-O)-methyltransferase [Candidatus Methanolliviera sp. GoM_oil]|nr:MAG: tRNA (cytidine(56)-2'-O)-methyltransferase [Candidatus Methanolliviera sp. GoM_oil]
MPINEKIEEIREIQNLIVVVGSEKAPKELYEMVDYNISVTSQPHSEVAALAIFLHEYWKGGELDLRFDGKLKVLPMEHGKNVLSV